MLEKIIYNISMYLGYCQSQAHVSGVTAPLKKYSQ